VKVTHLTETTEHDLASSPLYHEAYTIGRQLNVLLEAEALTPAQVEQLFAAAEETMTSTGDNKTMLGKVGAGVGAVVDKVKGLGRLLQDTSIVRGLDQSFDDAKAKIAAKMGQSEGGAQVLQKLDAYRQFWEKYPVTGKFMYGLLTVLTGYASAGVTGPILLGATKTADDLLKNKSFSGSVGAGAMQGGAAAAMVGAKNLAGAAVDAAAPVAKNIGQGISDLGTAAQAGANKIGSAISQGAQSFADNAKGLIPDASAAEPVTPSAQTVTPSATDAVTPPKPAVDPNANPGAPVNPDTPPAPAGAGYKTVGGDELGKLAQANNTTTQAIIDANPELAKQLNPAMNGKDLKIGVDVNIPKNTVPQGTNPFTGNKFFKMGESVMFKAGTGILEGITVGYLAKSEMFDRTATLQKWALNESLGRKSRPLYLSERGIDTLFDNVEKLWERDIEEARRNDWGREANAEIGRAAGRLGMTGQEFAQQKPVAAAAMGIGGNTRTYSNYTSNPEPNRFPGSPKPQKGNPNWRSTKYTGQVGNKFMDKVEKGLSTAGAYAGNLYKQATTKVNKERLMRMWKDAGSPLEVDSVGQILARNGVPQEYIMSLFSTMGLPAPQNLTPAKTTFSDDDIIDAANAAMSGGPALTPAQKVRLDAIRQRQGLGPVNAPVADPSTAGGAAGATTAPAGGTAPGTTAPAGGTAPGATAPGTSAGGSAGDGQTAMATTMILPQIARMVGTQYSDDLITIIDTAMSVLQRSAPTAYREKLMQLRGQTSGKKLEPAADQIARVKNKKKNGAPGAPAAADAPPATRPLGPTRVTSNNPGAPTDAERAKFDQRVAQATAIGSDLTPNPPGAELAMQDLDNFDLMNRSARAESRKVFGGKYIKESADAKIARDFEKFVMAME
jgi:LysM repeat protein